MPAARGGLEWEDIPAAVDQLGRYVRRFGVPPAEPLADQLDAEAVALAELERAYDEHELYCEQERDNDLNEWRAAGADY